MKRASLFIISLLLLTTGNVHANSKSSKSFINQSHAIFFPEAMKDRVLAPQSFPVFWWNFIVLNTPNQKTGEEVCQTLKRLYKTVAETGCEQELGRMLPLLRDWAMDLPLRIVRPYDHAIRKRLDQAFAEASLPGMDHAALELLRIDPFGSWKELRKLLEERAVLPFKQKNGFFVSENEERTIIPIQMAAPPSDTQGAAQITDTISKICTADKPCHWAWIGPHGSTLQNEQQIYKDTEKVSSVGLVILGLFALFFVLTHRSRLLLLIPPVLLSTAISAGITALIFGSIHGLTLAFGVGIIGLAIDYGLHAAFIANRRAVWTSNLYGLLTTLAGLLVLMTSSIPLLRQLMVFSALGLCLGFIIFYILFHFAQPQLLARPYAITPKPKRWKLAIVCLLMFLSFWGIFTTKPNLNMARFDFQDGAGMEIRTWLSKTVLRTPPLFTISNGEPNLSTRPNVPAVRTESVSRYVLPVSTQAENRRTWTQKPYEPLVASLPANQRIFFDPFIHRVLCAPPPIISFGKNSSPRAYLRHLFSNNRWITLWFPKDEIEENKVRSEFQATSLADSVALFPKTLASELAWMIPLSLLLSAGLLFFYYRKWSLTGLALVPFFTGVGAVVLASKVIGFPISFIGLIALVMVFGCSIDYGIFAVDLERQPADRPAPAVWTALALAAGTSIAGFLPMLFCQHPVLLDLGQTLFFGTIGTFLGAVWGIPALWRWSMQ